MSGKLSNKRFAEEWGSGEIKRRKTIEYDCRSCIPVIVTKRGLLEKSCSEAFDSARKILEKHSRFWIVKNVTRTIQQILSTIFFVDALSVCLTDTTSETLRMIQFAFFERPIPTVCLFWECCVKIGSSFYSRTFFFDFHEGLVYSLFETPGWIHGFPKEGHCGSEKSTQDPHGLHHQNSQNNRVSSPP